MHLQQLWERQVLVAPYHNGWGRWPDWGRKCAQASPSWLALCPHSFFSIQQSNSKSRSQKSCFRSAAAYLPQEWWQHSTVAAAAAESSGGSRKQLAAALAVVVVVRWQCSAVAVAAAAAVLAEAALAMESCGSSGNRIVVSQYC